YYVAGGERRTRDGDGGIELYQGFFGNWNIFGYTLVLLLPAMLAVRPKTTGGQIARIAALLATLASLLASRSATSSLAGAALLVLALVLRVIDRVQGSISPAARRAAWRRLSFAAAGATLAVGAAGVTTVMSLGKDFTPLSGRVPP